jgi:hypothetical protein
MAFEIAPVIFSVIVLKFINPFLDKLMVGENTVMKSYASLNDITTLVAIMVLARASS